MFTVTINLKDIHSTEDMKEAYGLFITKTKELVNEGTTTQLLETCCWVTKDGRHPQFIYDIVEYSHNKGWMENGNWVF